MPKELPERIKRLMEDQAEEAALPVSYSILRSVKPEAAEDPPGESDEVTPSPSDEVPQNEVQPAPEDWQVADPNEGNEQSQPPEDWNQPQGELTAPPQDWEQPEPARSEAPDMEPAEDANSQQSAREDAPDLESTLGFMGQQGNDQLFDGLAIQMAESVHRQMGRFQDRFDQRMAELDIGNSY